MVRGSPCVVHDLEAGAGIEPFGRVVGMDAEADRAHVVALGPGHERTEQQRADALDRGTPGYTPIASSGTSSAT